MGKAEGERKGGEVRGLESEKDGCKKREHGDWKRGRREGYEKKVRKEPKRGQIKKNAT